MARDALVAGNARKRLPPGSALACATDAEPVPEITAQAVFHGAE